MRMSARRDSGDLRKEMREYRRNGQIVVTMAVFPLLFSVYPAIEIFALPASAAGALAGKEPLVYMLAIPALVPATLAALSVAGERQQGTLEPVLTTPIRGEEFLLGKALAALVPSLVVSYGVFAVFVAASSSSPAGRGLRRTAWSGAAGPAALHATRGRLSIWVAIAISARSNDPRVAAQLSVLASLPTIIVATVIALGGIPVTPGLVLGLGVALLLLDGLGWRIVSPMFDRERLITGTRS